MFMSKPNHAQSSSSSSSQCRKHPKHKQSPGVCSLCLTQKLVKVSPDARTRAHSLPRRVYSEEGSSCESSRMSYSSSSDASSDVSSCVSPGRDMGLVTGIVKMKEKCRFWTRLALISRRKKTRGCFQGQLVLSHSEPLPTITTAS